MEINQLHHRLYHVEPIGERVRTDHSLEMARHLNSLIFQLASFGRSSVRTFSFISAKRTLVCTSLMKRTMAYSTSQSGAPNTLDFRMYFRKYSLNCTHFYCGNDEVVEVVFHP